MAEEVVKDVGFLKVVELFAASDERGRRKSAVRQVIEEGVVGDQAGNRHDLPAGRATQDRAQAIEVGNPAIGRDPERGDAGVIIGGGASFEQPGLPGEQKPPPVVLLRRVLAPLLSDDVRGNFAS